MNKARAPPFACWETGIRFRANGQRKQRRMTSVTINDVKKQAKQWPINQCIKTKLRVRQAYRWCWSSIWDDIWYVLMRRCVRTGWNMSETRSLSGCGQGVVRSFSGRSPVMVAFKPRSIFDTSWCRCDKLEKILQILQIPYK